MVKFIKTKNFNSDIKNPVLIIGLPGVGNIGKIVTDLIIDQQEAKELGSFIVDLPAMVFPSKDGVEFPSIKLYHKKIRETSYLFLAGDYQPRDANCFKFCERCGVDNSLIV